MENQNEEPSLTFDYIMEYIRDNFIGLLLLISVGFIIYISEYINSLNALVFTTPSPIPGVTNPITNNVQKKLPKVKKNKKR
jgi:hypothetical protein